MRDRHADVESALRARLAARHGHADTIFTATGSAALEIAVGQLSLHPGAEVVVPDEACHRVAASVVRAGATPVFAAVDRSLVLQPAAAAAALSSSTVGVVAVHQYGLPAPVRALRCALPEIVTIVEDVAQAWDARRDGRRVGGDGAWSVTSFGAAKPVRVGAGGAIMGPAGVLNGAVSCTEACERALDRPPFPAPFPEPLLPALRAALDRADALVARRRAFVDESRSLLWAAGLEAHRVRDVDAAAWQRLPVWARDRATRDRLLAACARVELRAQAPHPEAVAVLPMFHGSRSVGERDEAGRDCLALVGTDQEDAIERLATALARL